MTGIRSFCTKKISISLLKHLIEAVDYVKTDLMPDFDFDAFNHDNYEENAYNELWRTPFLKISSNVQR